MLDILLVCRRSRQLPLMRVQIIIPNLAPFNSCLEESQAPAMSCVPLMPAPVAAGLWRPQTWRQSIIVSKNHTLLRSVDARSSSCGRCSGGRADPSAAPAAAAGAAPGAAGAAAPPTPLRRLRVARAAHEPRVMIDSQCNVHTAICVQYQVGSRG